MIICPYCGTENYKEVAYCKNCLNRLRELIKKEIKVLARTNDEEGTEKTLRKKLIWAKTGTRS